MTKPQWVRQNPQQNPSLGPSPRALWIYGNDLDWDRSGGPEHAVYASDARSERRALGHVGRADRDSNRRNLAFILRRGDLARLGADPLRVTIENRPGGPYSSRVFAVYLMPDDGAGEDEATRLIEQQPDEVRRRAAAFVEFEFNGQPCDEGRPLSILLESAPAPRP